MQPGHQSVVQCKIGTRFQEFEVLPEVFRWIESLDQLTRHELVQVRAVVVEPRVHISRWSGLKRPINTETIDAHMREALVCQLSDVCFPIEMFRTSQASYEKIAEIS